MKNGHGTILSCALSVMSLACDAASAGQPADTAKQSAGGLSFSAHMVMRNRLPKEALEPRDPRRGTDGRFITHGIRVNFQNAKPGQAYEIRWRQFEQLQSGDWRRAVPAPEPEHWNCIVRTVVPCDAADSSGRPQPVYLTAGSMGVAPEGENFHPERFTRVPRPFEFDGTYLIQVRESPEGFAAPARWCDDKGFDDQALRGESISQKKITVDYLEVCRKGRVFDDVNRAVRLLKTAFAPGGVGIAHIKPSGRFANSVNANRYVVAQLDKPPEPVHELVVLGGCIRSLFNRAFPDYWMRFDKRMRRRENGAININENAKSPLVDIAAFPPTTFHYDNVTDVRALWSESGTWGCTQGEETGSREGGVRAYRCTGDVLEPEVPWSITYVGDGPPTRTAGFPAIGLHQAPPTLGAMGHLVARYFLRRSDRHDHPGSWM